MLYFFPFFSRMKQIAVVLAAVIAVALGQQGPSSPVNGYSGTV